MVYFDGLKVELRADRSLLEEYESAACVRKSSGRSVHRIVRLQPNVPFSIYLHVDRHIFKRYQPANGLKIGIDFDDGQEVKDTELYFRRAHDRSNMNPDKLSHTLNGDEYIHISRIILNGSTPWEAQDAEFRTCLIPAHRSGRKDLQGEGTIKVAIHLCKFMPSARERSALHSPEKSGAHRPSAEALRAAGIHSQIELFNRVPRARGLLNFRSISIADGLAGTFCFHYRVPQEYAIIKDIDQRSYDIQDAGPGRRRIFERIPEPLAPAGYEDDSTNQEITMNSQQTTGLGHEGSPDTQFAETTEVMMTARLQPIEDRDLSFETGSASHTSDIGSDEEMREATVNEVNLESEALSIPATSTELEALLEREEELVNDLQKLQDRRDAAHTRLIDRIREKNDQKMLLEYRAEQLKRELEEIEVNAKQVQAECDKLEAEHLQAQIKRKRLEEKTDSARHRTKQLPAWTQEKESELR